MILAHFRRFLGTRLAWLGFLAGWVPAVAGAQPDDAAATVVLANRNVVESVDLARYYLKARGIPDEHLCLLDLPEEESISREEFDSRLKTPLWDWLVAREWFQVKTGGEEAESSMVVSNRLKYLVSIYGIPLRIAESGNRIKEGTEPSQQGALKDTAAVDSELAALLHSPYDLAGIKVNPLFRAELWPPIASPASQVPLIAARLDGPTPDVVRSMIDGALFGERYGLLGRAYFDLRGTVEPGYVLGEIWIQEAYHRMMREGFECVIQGEPEVWRSSYPMEDAAFYLGWYTEHVTGPFTRDEFRMPPGSIAYHLHSGAAATLRSDSRHWAGPLVARGAAATMGGVSEPFLVYTPQLHFFTSALCTGHSFGESLYLAQSVLSWQIAVVGDPLYRPFRLSLDEQIANLEADRRPEVAWAHVRKANILARRGQLNLALGYLRAKLQESNSPILREKLGDLYAINELFSFASDEYRALLAQEVSPATTVRAAARAIWLLKSLGRPQDAVAVYDEVRGKLAGNVMLFWLSQFEPQGVSR